MIFAGVADEEAACAKGSLFLVDEHPEKVRAEYTFGEIGAFSLHVFGRTFYPIQTAEKGVCWVRATFEGEPGHGSMPKEDNAVLKLGRAIARLGKSRLPQHPTEAVSKFLEAMASELPAPQKPRSSASARRSSPRSSSITSCATSRSVGRSARSCRTRRRPPSCAAGAR